MFGDLAPIERKGLFVHTSPKGDFDTQQMIDAYKEVFAKAEDLEYWVLFEHPHTSAGFTTSALQELINNYRMAADKGCVGIIVGGSSIFKQILDSHIPADFPIPVNISDDEDSLKAYAEALLQQR